MIVVEQMGRQRERSLESAEEVLWPAVRILGLLFLTDAGSLEHPHHHFLLTPFRPGVESTCLAQRFVVSKGTLQIAKYVEGRGGAFGAASASCDRKRGDGAATTKRRAL